MNSLALSLYNTIKEEIKIISDLKKISLKMKDIIISRDLSALNENSLIKKANLLNMIALQRKKDALISDLAVELNLDKDSSVYEIIGSDSLDRESKDLLSEGYKFLEEEIRSLRKTNALVSLLLQTASKLNKTITDIFNVQGTIGTTYSRNVKVKASMRRSEINQKI